MAFVKLNDASSTRVNLDQVVAYTAVTTSGSEALNFELSINNTTSILSLDVTYSGATADEQVRADLGYVDHVAGVYVARTAADQDA